MTTAVQDVKPNWPVPPELKWAPVNGYPMSYRDVGEGPPIVLIHGSITDYRSWHFQFETLTKEYRLLAVNLRRHYPERWDGIGSDYTVAQHTSDVTTLIKTLKLGRVHLVGWSRGGCVAMEIVKSAPEVVRTLILEDGSIEMPVNETPELQEAAKFITGLIRKLQNDLGKMEKSEAARQFVDAVNNQLGTWEGLPELSRRIVRDNIYTALGQQADRPMTTCDDIRKIDFPVLLMTGEKSPKRYDLFYREMRKCKEFPPTVIIPNAAHAMHLQNPQAFDSAILTFIRTYATG